VGGWVCHLSVRLSPSGGFSSPLLPWASFGAFFGGVLSSNRTLKTHHQKMKKVTTFGCLVRLWKEEGKECSAQTVSVTVSIWFALLVLLLVAAATAVHVHIVHVPHD